MIQNSRGLKSVLLMLKVFKITKEEKCKLIYDVIRLVLLYLVVERESNK